MARPQFTKQMTVAEFGRLFPNADACKAYLTARRWPDGVRCPRCRNDKLAALVVRPFHWQCRGCSDTCYRFSVLVGTFFESTKIGRRDWFRVIHMMMASTKSVAALEVQHLIGFGSYRTAHYLCHRTRAGLVDPEFRKLVGIVEADETHIGGKVKNKHRGRCGMGSGVAGELIVANRNNPDIFGGTVAHC